MPRKNTARLSNLEKYNNWIKTLRNASKKHLIVCQHKRDKTALKTLGCKNVVHEFQPFVDFVDWIAATGKPVVLLYNTDRNSNAKAEKLLTTLRQHGVKVNPRFRKLLYVEPNRTVSGVLKAIARLAGTERKLPRLR